jgi:type IX secretion system PorP/SprF family membrane protein
MIFFIKIKSFMKYFALMIVGLFATSVLLQAQQLTNFNLYSQNKYTLNPANAGDQEHCLLFFNNRSQWVSVDGAPQTTMFGVHGPVSDKIGLGVYFYSDQTDVLKRNSFAISYSYKTQIATDHFLSFGVSAGAIDQHVDYDQVVVDDPNDNLLLSSIGDGYCFDAGVGIRYHWKDFEFGFSVPQLFETSIRHQSNYGNFFFSLTRHYLLFASYDFYLKKYNMKLTPISYFRSAEVGPTQLDVGVIGEWNKLVWLGVSYRQGGEYDFSMNTSGIILSTGMKLYEKVDFSYSYEIYKNGLSSESSGTHEVSLAYHFNNPHKNEIALDEILDQQKELLYRIDSLQREIEKIKFDLEKLTEEFEKDKLEKQQMIDDLNLQIDSLKSLIDLKKISDTHNDSNIDVSSENDTDNKDLQEQLRQLKDRIKQLNDRVFNLNNDEEITVFDENNAQLINSANKLNEHSKELISVEESTEEVENKLQDLKVMEYSLDKIEDDLDNLKRKNEEEVIQDFSGDNIVNIDRESGGESNMEKGYYVVVMAFRNYEYAQTYYDKLNNSGVSALIAHNKTRGFYYVYVNKLDKEQNAINKKHEKENRYEGIWIYQY